MSSSVPTLYTYTNGVHNNCVAKYKHHLFDILIQNSAYNEGRSGTQRPVVGSGYHALRAGCVPGTSYSRQEAELLRIRGIRFRAYIAATAVDTRHNNSCSSTRGVVHIIPEGSTCCKTPIHHVR